MEKLLYIRITVISLWLLSFAGISLAEERFTIFEMVDGNMARFQMSPEEITTEDAKKVYDAKTKQIFLNKPKKWVVGIELPESGRLIVFPMSDKEIQAAKSSEKESTAIKAANYSINAKKVAVINTTTFEMVDGNTVTFTQMN